MVGNRPMTVEVEGLFELRRALRAFAPGSQKNLQKRFKAIAVEVAGRARGKVPVSGAKTQPKRSTSGWPFFPSGSAAKSVRARATQTSAIVIAGGPKAPYYPWLEWGGSTGRGHEPRRGGGAIPRTWLGAGGMSEWGRYIYPTIQDMSGEITDSVKGALADTKRETGLE